MRFCSGHPKVHFGTIVEGSLGSGVGAGVRGCTEGGGGGGGVLLAFSLLCSSGQGALERKLRATHRTLITFNMSCATRHKWAAQHLGLTELKSLFFYTSNSLVETIHRRRRRGNRSTTSPPPPPSKKKKKKKTLTTSFRECYM